jgi:ABC-type lipoprotein export system ATPase subunit
VTLLEARGLCMVYRPGSAAEVRALGDVSLSVEEGSFTVLTGPSGSGKTTLLALLGALDRPTRGEVVFRGRALAGLSDAERARVRRRMGFVFQDFSLIGGLSVWENVTYPLIPRGLRRAERFERARALLARLGMADQLFKRPKELSGGEQQRVAVARALAGRPEVLLADEPTSQLDPQTAGELLAIFREVHAEGKTVILSSHDPILVGLGTRVFELERGRLKMSRPDAPS